MKQFFVVMIMCILTIPLISFGQRPIPLSPKELENSFRKQDEIKDEIREEYEQYLKELQKKYQRQLGIKDPFISFGQRPIPLSPKELKNSFRRQDEIRDEIWREYEQEKYQKKSPKKPQPQLGIKDPLRSTDPLDFLTPEPVGKIVVKHYYTIYNRNTGKNEYKIKRDHRGRLIYDYKFVPFDSVEELLSSPAGTFLWRDSGERTKDGIPIFTNTPRPPSKKSPQDVSYQKVLKPPYQDKYNPPLDPC